MSAAHPAGVAPDQGMAQVWSAAALRVRAYLEVAGLKSDAAAELADEIVVGCAADRPAPAEDEAILAGLRVARRLLTDKPPRDGEQPNGGPLAPRDQPLSIRRRAFRSLIDWRLATSRLRRLLPAGAPQRVRRAPDAPTPHNARLTARARARRAAFTFLIIATTIWGWRASSRSWASMV